MPMKKKASKAQPVSFETVRQLALELPGIEEGTSYGTPALKVRGKLLARLREDGETLVIKIDFSDRDLLMQAAPDTFFVTEHYVNHPLMLVRLSSVRREQLRRLLEDAWRGAAPKRLVSAYDAED